MKKSIIALFAAATMVAGVSAQEVEGGSGAGGAGVVTGGVVASAAVGLGVLVAVSNNNSADAPTVVDPDPATPTCEGDDPLVDGVCVGTTNTVTVTTSGTTTATTTVTVPVTFTYAPTVQ
ncbi:hypothetical protein CW735_00250 [Alteromonas sp. MB-3u-76]|jgi:hypothetical protein|uniref:hypothetical protein n=1 Tax=unclassified Alteromonas TaxID=2614992 RepID=UPI00090454C9|nr:MULTISPECIES: hypothetical protein [unclassified Alteromonas]APE04400.1 hypothetical protein BM528_00260 [Alteromonas sp. RW2A1]AUC86806.1 hypothetical protein CW735_00250 [Alteromonas sp. MB-3u-76]